MGWLRKERDLIGLVAAWTLLLQSIVLPLATGLHAAPLTAETVAAGIICTSRAAAITPENEKQSRKSSDCQVCHASCRQSCGGPCGGGILPTFARVPLASSTRLALAASPFGASRPEAALEAVTQPRAPPRA